RQHALGNRLQIARDDYAFYQHRKLIASQPCRRILRTQRAQQSLRSRYQNNVSRSMAEHVINLFELVEIQKQYSAALIGPPHAPREGLIQPIHEEGAVRQSRKNI